MSELILINHSKPLDQRRADKQTYFCKLCRKSNIKLRNAHLRNHHKAHDRIFLKRKDEELLNAIFLVSRS